MPRVTVLPHPEYAPGGASIEVEGKSTLIDALLEHGIEIEHACGKVGACTTCHVVVSQGFDSLNPVDENEEDMLDKQSLHQIGRHAADKWLSENLDAIGQRSSVDIVDKFL